MGQELDYVILICNASVVLSHMFSGGPNLQDVDLGHLKFGIRAVVISLGFEKP